MEFDTQPKRIIGTLFIVWGALLAYYVGDFIIFASFIFGVEWGIITIAVNAGWKPLTWFNKWLMFLAGLVMGNKVYGSKFDDGVSWRKT